MIRNYVLIAWRSLVKNKVYSTINVLGLSLGFAVCMLISLFVKDEFSFDQFQEKKENLYRLVVGETSSSQEAFNFGDTGFKHGKSFYGQIPELDKMVRIQGEMVNIRHNNDIFLQTASIVDSSFFDLFSATFVEGSPYMALESPESVVISESVAKKYFGNEPALGKFLEIERDKEFKPHKIMGVTRDMPMNSTIRLDLLLPIDYAKPTDEAWINFYLNTFFLLKPGSDVAKVETQMNSIFANEAKDELAEAKKQWNYDNQLEFKLQPFLDLHLSKTYRAQNGLNNSTNSNLSYVLSGLALFILLIACINFINISIAHSMQRSREIGVRKAVGGMRKQLIFQFMSESFLLNLTSFILALIWVQLALPIFNQIASKSLAFEYLLDYRLILAYLAIFLFTGFLTGFYPALVLSSYKPVDTLYGKVKAQGKSQLQKSLIVFQFGLASLFIVLTLVQSRQVDYFLSRDLGYNDKNLIVLDSRENSELKGKTFRQELLRIPNIQEVAPKNSGTWFTAVSSEEGKQIGPNMNVVDQNFVGVLGLTLVEGRNFSEAFPSDSAQSVMVNEAFVKEAGWDEPIGKIIKIYNQYPVTVIGVLKDYHFGSLYENIKPQIFTSNPRYGGYSAFFIRTNGENVASTLDQIEATFKQVYPTEPFSYDYQSELNKEQYDKEFQMRKIAMWTAGIMILISCMGLFGLSILTTERRTKEIGVRKVLGASLWNIIRQLSWDFMKLIIVAFVISSPIAYFIAEQMLRDYPYRTEFSTDLYLWSFLTLVTLSFLTIAYQSLKSAMGNPVKALRTE